MKTIFAVSKNEAMMIKVILAAYGSKEKLPRLRNLGTVSGLKLLPIIGGICC